MDAVAEPNPTPRSAEAGGLGAWAPPPRFPWTVLVLAGLGEALGEQSRALLLVLTHVSGGKVLADVWKRNLIYCGKKNQKPLWQGHEY